MDLPLAIDANRNRLLLALAGLAAMIGDGETVLRHVRWAVLAVLRPAEAALRRLIAVAAIDVVIGPTRAGPKGGLPRGKRSAERVPCFALFDRRLQVDPKQKRVRGFGPNIRFLDGEDIMPPANNAPKPDDPVSAAALRQRLAALLNALNDIPGNAKRLARALAKKPRPMRAMRPGRPPGFRAKGKRAIDEVLADCHALALLALHEAAPP